MTIEFEAVEKKRVRLGMTKTELCRRAGVACSTYAALLASRHEARTATLAKLNTVLNKKAAGFGEQTATNAYNFAYRSLLALVAYRKDLPAAQVLSANPTLRATNNPEWRRAADCRRITFHVLNGAFGFRVADIARAAGVTKAAVSLAIKEIEDARDFDSDLDHILNDLTYLLS